MRNRSNDAFDPLSNVLDLLEVRCELSGELLAGGDWARRFSNTGAIKFCAAIQGSCWYCLDGMDVPTLFEPGDVLVLNGELSLTLASDSSLIAGASTGVAELDSAGRYRLGKGSTFTMLGGIVRIAGDWHSYLQDGLPALIHVRATSDEAEPLTWLLGQLTLEMSSNSRPGRSMVTTGLTQLIFLQTLRAYMTQASSEDKGWLKGFGDRKLVIALAAIHSEPAHPWSLDELAKKASMSRTAFAVRFRDMMGLPPLAYIAQWRMQLAKRELQAGASVAEAAISVGYTSESAFSSAFKRCSHIAPGKYRRTFVAHQYEHS